MRLTIDEFDKRMWEIMERPKRRRAEDELLKLLREAAERRKTVRLGKFPEIKQGIQE